MLLLHLFQANNPMVPFTEHTLADILPTLMKNIVKSWFFGQVFFILKLSKLDLSNSENTLPYELMKLPTATKSSLWYVDLSNKNKRYFLKNAKQMIIMLIQKFQKRCPLKYQDIKLHVAQFYSPLVTWYLICRNISTIWKG